MINIKPLIMPLKWSWYIRKMADSIVVELNISKGIERSKYKSFDGSKLIVKAHIVINDIIKKIIPITSKK
jgi:hypothetical protein